MKAIIVTKHGDSSVLELKEVSKPIPGAGEILVKVAVIGINYADILLRKGVYPMPSLPAIAGGEITGIIEEIGENVTNFKRGQSVAGVALEGYAEYALLKATETIILPDGLEPAQGLIFQALTACHLLDQTMGYKSILVTAAAGGVGSLILQIARYRNIPTIVAMIGNKEKTAHAKASGATQVISYQDADWSFQLQQVCSDGIDLVLDSVGGDTGSTLVNHLSFGGTMVTFGNSSGQASMLPAQQLIWKANKLIGATIYTATPAKKQQWANEITELIRMGLIHQKIAVWPLELTGEAQDAVEQRKLTGRAAIIL